MGEDTTERLVVTSHPLTSEARMQANVCCSLRGRSGVRMWRKRARTVRAFAGQLAEWLAKAEEVREG